MDEYEFRGLCPKSSIDNILCELDKLTISDVHKKELKEYLNDILSINIDELKHGQYNVRANLHQNTIIALIKFAESTINGLKVFQVLSPQHAMVCNAVVGVVEYICLNNVDASVLKKFSRILESDFQARCLATCDKISQCIGYMQGLPKPEELDRDQKHLHLQLIASDVSIQTGLDELLTLGVKIEDILSSPDEGNFCQLMEKVRLYCCMATFRELFLLYRFAIQSTFDVDATSVTRVSDAQRTRDREILKFLYRPTAKNARFFCKYNAQDWPIVSSFMDRRGLHTEDLSGLGGDIFQIQSMCFEDRCLSARKRRLNPVDTVQCESITDAKSTLFQLQGGKNNLFTIYPCVYDTPCHVRDSKLTMLEISAGQPTTSGLWYIQKVYPDSPEGTPFYVVRLASENKKWLYASQMNGIVYAKSSNSVGPKHFWGLKHAEHLYFQHVGQCNFRPSLFKKY